MLRLTGMRRSFFLVPVLVLLAPAAHAWPTQGLPNAAEAPRTVESIRKKVGTPTAEKVTPLIARLAPPKPKPGTMVTQAASVPIVASYAIAGETEGGKKWTGIATIAKIGGDMYSATWKLGQSTFYGECFRDDDTLSCGWALKKKDANVMAYLVAADGLDGVWFGDGDAKLGKELLSPANHGSMGKTPAGSYTITKGENGDGSKYSGSATITQKTDLGQGFFQLEWVIGGSKSYGLGVRNLGRGEDDILTVSFVDQPGDYGAVQYTIDAAGKVLSGTVIESIGGRVSSGKETLTKTGILASPL